MNRYISLVIILWTILNMLLFWASNTHANEYKEFVISTYYSPIPDQEFYHMWSYRAEIKMNWKWTHWASWREVFLWMVAAPPSYPFWTKIYLEWLWVVEVADRWCAIVESWRAPCIWPSYNSDRLDIWVWHSDERLARAMTFWKQTIKWYILSDSDTPVSLNLDGIPAPLSAIERFRVRPPKSWTTTNAILASSTSVNLNKIHKLRVSPEYSKSNDVKYLQEILKDFDRYNWKIDGEFNSVKDVFIKYQVDTGLISGYTSSEAGYFWPKTLAQINIDYSNYLSKKQELDKKKQEVEKNIDAVTKNINNHINSIPNLWVWYNRKEVFDLQDILKALWYYEWKSNWNFWTETTAALINYQLDKWIIKTGKEADAGYFWPKTRESMKDDLRKIYEQKFKLDEKLFVYNG